MTLPPKDLRNFKPNHLNVLGKAAYDGYIAKTDGKSLIIGDALPAWADLKPAIQEAWVASAIAVRDALVVLRARDYTHSD